MSLPQRHLVPCRCGQAAAVAAVLAAAIDPQNCWGTGPGRTARPPEAAAAAAAQVAARASALIASKEHPVGREIRLRFFTNYDALERCMVHNLGVYSCTICSVLWTPA